LEEALDRFDDEPKRLKGGQQMRFGQGRRRLIPLAMLAVLGAAAIASSATARPSAATPIKIAVLSDCQGAFGAFDNQDLAGVVSAMSEYAGAKPKDPNKPRAGWTGGASISRAPPRAISSRTLMATWN
jgi:hypothetical protein